MPEKNFDNSTMPESRGSNFEEIKNQIAKKLKKIRDLLTLENMTNFANQAAQVGQIDVGDYLQSIGTSAAEFVNSTKTKESLKRLLMATGITSAGFLVSSTLITGSAVESNYKIQKLVEQSINNADKNGKFTVKYGGNKNDIVNISGNKNYLRHTPELLQQLTKNRIQQAGQIRDKLQIFNPNQQLSPGRLVQIGNNKYITGEESLKQFELRIFVGEKTAELPTFADEIKTVEYGFNGIFINGQEVSFDINSNIIIGGNKVLKQEKILEVRKMAEKLGLIFSSEQIQIIESMVKPNEFVGLKILFGDEVVFKNSFEIP